MNALVNVNVNVNVILECIKIANTSIFFFVILWIKLVNQKQHLSTFWDAFIDYNDSASYQNIAK